MADKKLLDSNDVRFIIKLIIESKNIHGQDIDRVVLLLNKLKNALKEL
jgi:hypothetical protein|tara:strand:+ start:227 stop:370 length:144 start_codon:yes stop_codon:yes gene_type:complete